MTITIQRSIWINAPRERVWPALIDPVELGKWWEPNEWTIVEAVVGGTVKFGFGEDTALATITALESERELTLEWEPNTMFPTTMTSTLRLEDENGGTRVTALETGFEGLPEDTRQTLIQGNEEGYEAVLRALKDLIERSQ